MGNSTVFVTLCGIAVHRNVVWHSVVHRYVVWHSAIYRYVRCHSSIHVHRYVVWHSAIRWHSAIHCYIVHTVLYLLNRSMTSNAINMYDECQTEKVVVFFRDGGSRSTRPVYKKHL